MPDPSGLYVHVPFCISKCPYCDFFSVIATDRIPEYLKDIQIEFELFGKDAGPVDTLYVGGGTPSVLKPDHLAELIQLASRDLLPGSEVTVELNPADVSARLLDALGRAGVNRVSLGVQSYFDDELSFLGRRHDRAGAIRAIEAIQEAHFATLGLDLIYGLPGAEPGRWQENLEQALAFHPEHLSCYALTIGANTPFGEKQARGELVLPGEALCADLFTRTSETLRRAGFEHYEVSNFARTRALRSRHNQKYWLRIPCLGLGPAAHSFDGRSRWQNHRSFEEYHAALAAGLRPVEEIEEIDPEKARLEILSLGMRTSDGAPMDAIRAGKSNDADVQRLIGEGLAEEKEGRLCPTPRGLLMADGIARMLC